MENINFDIVNKKITAKNLDKKYIYWKNDFLYFDEEWKEIKNQKKFCELLCEDLQDELEYDPSIIYNFIKEQIQDIKKIFLEVNLIKESEKSKKYIGFIDGIYNLDENRLVPYNKKHHIIRLNNYKYNTDNLLIYENIQDQNVYDFIMLCIYDIMIKISNNYVFKSENADSIIPSLITIFGKYIEFVNMNAKKKKQKLPRIIYYTNTSKIDTVRYKDKLLVQIDNLTKIDPEYYNDVFNKIFTKYRDIYDSKEFIKPDTVTIIELAEEYKAVIQHKKKGRPIKYTEEERKEADKLKMKKWMAKAESKKKIAENSKRYYKKNKNEISIKRIYKNNINKDQNDNEQIKDEKLVNNIGNEIIEEEYIVDNKLVDNNQVNNINKIIKKEQETEDDRLINNTSNNAIEKEHKSEDNKPTNNISNDTIEEHEPEDNKLVENICHSTIEKEHESEDNKPTNNISNDIIEEHQIEDNKLVENICCGTIEEKYVDNKMTNNISNGTIEKEQESQDNKLTNNISNGTIEKEQESEDNKPTNNISNGTIEENKLFENICCGTIEEKYVVDDKQVNNIDKTIEEEHDTGGDILIDNNKPKITKTTKKPYDSHYKRILKIYPDHNNIIEINELTVRMKNNNIKSNVQKTMLAALKHKYVNKEIAIEIDSLKKLDNRSKILASKVQKNEKSGKLTKRERLNFVSWQTIIKVVKKMKAIKNIKNNQELDLDYLILSIFTKIPPRRNDIAKLQMKDGNDYDIDQKKILKVLLDYDKINNYKNIKDKEECELDDDNDYEDEETESDIEDDNIDYKKDKNNTNKKDDIYKSENITNYYIQKDNKSYFIFENYKTSKTYGRQIIEIPESLDIIIKEYIEKYEIKIDDYIINKTRCDLSKRISKIFDTFIGKTIGSNVLRHIFITNCYKKELLDTYQKREDIAFLMGHSVNRQIKYYKIKYEKYVEDDIKFLINHMNLYKDKIKNEED